LNLAEFATKEFQGVSYDKEYEILCWKKQNCKIKVSSL
jgi:hypothetical protein